VKKAFTLIELMIVVAIIAIIAAIAIPNLLESRKQANETTGIGALRSIAAAESIFKKSNYAAAAGLANAKQYSPTLAGLCTTQVNGADINLVPPPIAAAEGAAGVPYQGYRLGADGIATWDDQFGFFAWPSTYPATGVNTYYIGTDATVYMSDTTGATAPANPFNPALATWTTP